MKDEFVILYKYYKHILTKYNGRSAEPIIPEEVEVIGERAFENCSFITSIRIPTKVEEIRDKAFSGCTNLKSVMMEGVRIIGESAFENCFSLTNVQLAEYTSKIENYAFSCCKKLQSIMFPENIEEICDYAFYQCENLTSIFLQEDQLWPSNRIFPKAFLGCTVLSSIRIGDDVYKGREYVTENSTNWDPDDVYGRGIIHQYDNDLEGYKFLGVNPEVTYKEEKVEIKFLKMTLQEKHEDDFDVFNGNLIQYKGNQTDIIIPQSLTTICESSFINNQTITSVIIPEGVQRICENAFSGCSNLESIDFEEGLKEIGKSAFSDCTALTRVQLPRTIKVIGEKAFSGCNNLTSIIIQEGVEWIGEHAFFGCTNLKSIIIPENVKIINKRAFDHNQYLRSVTIPKCVELIGEHAFQGCDNLTEALIHAKLKEISATSFSNLGQRDIRIIYQHTSPTLTIFGKKESNTVTLLDEKNNLTGELYVPHAQTLLYDCEVQPVESYVEFIARLIGGVVKHLSEYDALFTDCKISSEEKVKIALTRLQYPLELSVEYKDEYLAYLQNISHYQVPFLIRENDIATIQILAEHKAFYKQDIDKFIEQANQIGETEIQAFLMDYKNKTWGKEPVPHIKLSEEFDPKDWFIHENGDGSLTIQRYIGDDVNITIRAEIDGKTVKKIDGWNLGDAKVNLFTTRRDKIESVVIEDGIEVIGDRAFLECHNLNSIMIPASVKKVGKEAFYGCDNLIIKAPKGSYAIQYAKYKDMKFEEI